METDQVGRLRDILEAARLIGSYVKDTALVDFNANKEKQDAMMLDLLSLSGNAERKQQSA